MKANLPLIALCAVVLVVSQHVLMRMQIDALSNLPAGAGRTSPAGLEGFPLQPFFAASGGAALVGLLQAVVYLFLYVALIFGAHAAILYDPEREARPGFAHFAYAPGRLGPFFWRLIVTGFRIFLAILLLSVPLFILAALLANSQSGALVLGMAVGVVLVSASLYFSMRYSLALPAAVADDADVSIAAAIARARPRLWSMIGASFLIGLVVAAVDFALSFVLGGGTGGGAANSPQRMAESLTALRGSPSYWLYVALSSVSGLIGAVYFAAVLSIGYRDATEEGLTRPRAEVF